MQHRASTPSSTRPRPTNPAFNERTGGDVEEAQAFFDRLQRFAFNGELEHDRRSRRPCTQQGPYTSIGVSPQQSQYLHVRQQP